ncbi:poly-beta-hydroxybutyrate polymerase [Trinickia symbiotica]|uniref:Poly-beta-hydroxybutyrate polymerase n=1 Tax=Trinickia symbiotica TaxID=863227 RepID=A0A2T3XQW5_9BURK|nr:alpha/beta fold hydrolase [Trinickia symbiotica]PTB18919.1 poly-beta-hydroxybutyrate polymerase [Trinickia symbiotica]
MDTRLKPALARGGDTTREPKPGRVSDSPFRELDHAKQAFIARVTAGFSPAALTLAFADWFIHMIAAPGKRLELASLAASNAARLIVEATEAPACEPPPSHAPTLQSDDRFFAPAWQIEPFRFWKQAFLLTEQWWSAATHEVPGTTRHHEDVVSFVARQWLDILAPANFILSNPEVLLHTLATCGANLVQGACNAIEDAERIAARNPPVGAETFRAGLDVATTPGSVVFRNHLIELIQYQPTTATVAAEPILIVPAWIMKYYILDLSPHNSLIRYLVDAGHTVFCISWRNVEEKDRNLGLDDYRESGVMAALDSVSSIMPDRKIHATGYCLGGTILAIAAAAMANDHDDRLASVTLLAAQTDFTEPGELQLFIDDSQVYFLESMMWDRGYLGANQMASSFRLLQSSDLIWSRVVHDYLLGTRSPMTDLMAWNTDTTRMPYRMHSEYLRKLFLDNDLASARYEVDGRPIALSNLRMPLFVVGTERDHIAPWRSVYKIHYLSDTDVTFVLASGGHNAGIVSEPGHAHREFRMKRTPATDMNVGPQEWVAAAERFDGSWWPAWHEWLAAHSSDVHVAPPPTGSPGLPPLGDAPGTYIFQK